MFRELKFTNAVRAVASLGVLVGVVCSLTACVGTTGGGSAGHSSSDSRHAATDSSTRLEPFSREKVENALDYRQVGDDVVLRVQRYSDEDLKRSREKQKKVEQLYANIKPEECKDLILGKLKDANVDTLKDTVLATGGLTREGGVTVFFRLKEFDTFKDDILQAEKQLATCKEIDLSATGSKIKYALSAYQPTYDGSSFEKLVGIELKSQTGDLPNIYSIKGLLTNGQTVTIESTDRDNAQKTLDLLVEHLRL